MHEPLALVRESWRDFAARVVAAFGVLVIWCPEAKKIGEVIPPNTIGTPMSAERTADQPFSVIGEATRQHWVRQCDFIGGAVAPLFRGIVTSTLCKRID